MSLYIYIYIYIFIIQCVKARAIPGLHQLLTSSDNTVSVAQRGAATPGATKQLFLLDRIYIYIYIYARSTKRKNYIVPSSSFLVQFVIFKTCLCLAVDSLYTYGNCFLMLRNHTGIVILRSFHSCWRLFALDQIQLDAYCTVVWRRYEATFKQQPVIPIFERNEMTECPRKTMTTNVNRIHKAYPTLFYTVGTQCLVSVFLPLVCLLLGFFFQGTVYSMRRTLFFESDHATNFLFE